MCLDANADADADAAKMDNKFPSMDMETTLGPKP